RARKHIIAEVVLRLLPRVLAELLRRRLALHPGAEQGDFELRFDLQHGLFGEQADHQLVDRRLAEFGALGELAARYALPGNVAAYRLDDTLAVGLGDRHGAARASKMVLKPQLSWRGRLRFASLRASGTGWPLGREPAHAIVGAGSGNGGDRSLRPLGR